MKLAALMVLGLLVVYPAYAGSTNQNANSNANANSMGQAQSVVVQGLGTQDRFVVPPGLSSLVGTPCMGSSTGSVGAAGFGIGLGTSWKDDECQLRENVKVVAHFDPFLAREMLNDLSGVREAQERLFQKRGTGHRGFTYAPVGASGVGRPYWCRDDMIAATEADRTACGVE